MKTSTLELVTAPLTVVDLYTVTLKSVGNPDYGQFTPISPAWRVPAETVKGIQDACAAYIAKFDLGGGNWPEPIVRKNGKPFARVTYNRRLWNPANGVELGTGEQIHSRNLLPCV